MMNSMSTENHPGHEALFACSKRSDLANAGSALRRRGAGGVPLLLGLLFVMIVLGAVILKGGPGDGQGEEFGLANRAGSVVEVEDAPAKSAEVASGPRVMSGVEAGPAGAYASMVRVFEGTGMIFGEVQVEAGLPYPERWTVTLEPSRVAEGRDKAVTRTLTSEPGQRDFEFRDLPMASYRIGVTAAGLLSRPQEVALFKLEGYEHMPGVNVVHVTSRLIQAASVEGRVRQANGDMAENLPIFLLDRQQPKEGRLEAVTDNGGGYRFGDVPTGNWLLYAGHPVHSLTPPIPVTVQLAPLGLDELQLPPLATLEIETTDEYGRPFPGVELIGYLRGSGNGSFRRTTDAFGRSKIPYLAPGPWRVSATHEEEGRRCRMDLVLAPGEEILRAMNMR